MTNITPLDLHRLQLEATCVLNNKDSVEEYLDRCRRTQARRNSQRAAPTSTDPPRPNPRRQAAGRKTRAMRGEVSEAGRASLREAIEKGQPWTKSTGPRTQAGKARSALNGKQRQKGLVSIRELRRYRATLRERILPMKNFRKLLESALQFA